MRNREGRRSAASLGQFDIPVGQITIHNDILSNNANGIDDDDLAIGLLILGDEFNFSWISIAVNTVAHVYRHGRSRFKIACIMPFILAICANGTIRYNWMIETQPFLMISMGKYKRNYYEDRN